MALPCPVFASLALCQSPRSSGEADRPFAPAPALATLLIAQTFLVGPRFQGVKMVPPGPHVISYSAASGQGDFGPTTSFFLFLASGQVGGSSRGA